MSEGVPWSPNFRPGVQKSDGTHASNLYRPPHPSAATGCQQFPTPFPVNNANPGMNHPTRLQNPGGTNLPDYAARPRMNPPPTVPTFGGQTSSGPYHPPSSTNSSASSFPGSGTSVFSQNPTSTSAINGPLPPTMPPTVEMSHQNPVSHSSSVPPMPGVSGRLGLHNAPNDSTHTHPSAGDTRFPHPLTHSSNSPRSISSNDVSPSPSTGGLPLPYNGMAQYTHPIRQDGSHESSGAATPTYGNQRSYQPSPVSTPQIDAIEGQFSQKNRQHPLQQPHYPPGHPSNPSSTTAGSANHSRSGSGASGNQFPPTLPGYQQPMGNTGAYQTGPPPPTTASSYQPPSQYGGLPGSSTSSASISKPPGTSPLEPPCQPHMASMPHLPTPGKRDISKPPTKDDLSEAPSTDPFGVPTSSETGMTPTTNPNQVGFMATGGRGMTAQVGRQSVHPPRGGMGGNTSSVGQPGFPPSGSPGIFPPSNQPVFPPNNVSAMMPPTNNQPGFLPGSSMMPPTNNPPGFPPISGSSMMPPTNNQPGFPPGSSMMPPTKNPLGVPPTSGSSMMPPTNNQPGFPPGSSMMPPTNNQPGVPPTSGSSMMPPTNNQPGFPPGSSMMPPTNNQPGFPPNSGAGMMPPTNNQPGFPPTRGIGMMPPTSSQPGFPPGSGSGGGIIPPPVFPTNSGSGMVPPSVDHRGIPPPSAGLSGMGSTESGRIPTVGQIGPPPLPGPTSMRPPGQPFNAGSVPPLSTNFSKMNLGPNRIVNLLQERVLIPADGIETVKPHFGNEYREHTTNCAPEIMRLTLNSLPQTSSLLNKARLPLGLHLHPFRDLSTIPVIQASVIVRCKSCRTYINPFVVFLDQRRWRCNICFRQNEVPNEFQFDPVSRQYGDPQRRPEIKSATVEFIAPSEYMLRPPQPAVYLFVLDVSRVALSTGYLPLFCHTLLDYLDRLPGDARTHIGLITFNNGLQFYKLDEERGPRMLLVNDIEDVFLPDHSGLVVNLGQHRETVEDLLNNLPESFSVEEASTGSCMGAALQAALKLVGPTGGRVTLVNCGLPDTGPGALKSREDPNQRAAPKSVAHLGPATDFYKALALECAGQQVAVDLFLLTNAYTDFATILGISRHSGGGIRVYPHFGDENVLEMSRFRADLRRYLSRKIGFEAVMRVRCTRGLAITAFYGNFFVRSTDLLSLPNVSPDAGYAMQIKIEDSLSDLASVSFQAALLYTSSKGERRIRVHTLSVPTTGVLEEVFRNADHCAVSCLLAKMAAERSVESGIREAREALVNAVLDVMKAYGDACLSSAQRIGSLGLPYNLRLLPLLVLALLKSRAFRLGVSTRLDDRVAMMEMFKSLPPSYLLPLVYPRLFTLNCLAADDGPEKPPQIHPSAQFTERGGAYLMDAGEYLLLLVGRETPQKFIDDVFGVSGFEAIPDGATELPERETAASEKLRTFVFGLRDERPIGMSLLVMRDDSSKRHMFVERMMDDRSDQLMAYTEFLQYLQSHVKYSS